MPLCVPRQVQSNDWVTVKQDAHFLIQKHTTRSPSAQSIRFRKGSPTPATNGLDSSKTPGTFRIIMRCNKLCLGEFTDRSELANQWRFLHPTESDLAFDPTGHDTMQHLWQEQMVSLQTHATEQSEQAFREQSSYLASVMTIMELAKTINPGSINAPVEENARMVVLLTSLSRQLLVASSELVDKIKGSKVAQDLRAMTSEGDTLTSSIKEMEDVDLEDPISVPLSQSSKLKVSSDEMPNLRGIEALVYHVDRLFELASKQESRINTIVKQVVSRRNNRLFMKSELLSNSIYYLPHVNRDCKAVDRKIFTEVAAELEKTLVPQSELYERILSHLNDRVATVLDSPNPIGLELAKAISSGKQFLAENLAKIREPTQLQGVPSSNPANDFVVMGNQNYFDMLKADMEQYAQLLTVGIQLSFDTGSQAGDRLGDLCKNAILEIILAHLYPSLITLFRSLNDVKDEKLTKHCDQLKEVTTAELAGLSPDFWQVVTAPNALADFFPLVEHFINADSVRLKYDYLDQMSKCAYKIASTGLKKIAAQAGKPYDPTKPGDALRFAVGADDFVPLFAYMLLQANIPDLHAQFAFLTIFTEETALIGKWGYLLASLQTGMMVVSQMDATKPTQSPNIPIETFTFIEDSMSSSVARSAFVRTSTSTALLAGADPLSRDDWDSEGNISAEELVENDEDVEEDAFEDGQQGTLSKGKAGRSSKLTKVGHAISKKFKVKSASEESDAIGSPIKRPSIAVLREQSMPNLWILNPISGDSSAPNSGKIPTQSSVSNSSSKNLLSSSPSSSVLGTITEPGILGDTAYSISLKLITLILCLYQRYENRLLSQQGPGSSSTPASSVKNDEIFRNYKEELQQLHRVKLDSLNDTQRIVFFLNIYHALLMHAFIEKDVPDSYQSLFNLMASAAYNIGGMSFTLLEIEHGVLRHWTPYPDELMDGMFHFPAKWKTSDWPKAAFAPKRADPRFNFVICPFASSGPPLRIYTAETLEAVLQASTEQYLRRNVLVSADNAVVLLPKQVLWYFREFGKKEKNLIDWIARYLEPAQQELLMGMKKYRLKYNEFDWTFVFHFESLP